MLENYIILFYDVATVSVQHWKHYITMFTQCSGNVVWTLVPNIQATLSQHCGNVEKLCNFQHCHNAMTMLSEICENVVCQPKYQHSHNIVPTFWDYIIFNVATMLLQCWWNTPRMRNLIFHFKNKIWNDQINSFYLVKIT